MSSYLLFFLNCFLAITINMCYNVSIPVSTFPSDISPARADQMMEADKNSQYIIQVHLCYCLLFMISLTMSMSIYHLLKLAMLILVILTVSSSLPSYFHPSFLPFLPWPLTNVFLLLPGLSLLFLLDRNQEHVSRVEWLWKERMKGEEEGVETMQGINRVLLENLLPAHVARHFLTLLKGSGPDELYSQKYDNICVMFASIPNFKEFYNENDINKQGLECIRLLNEIICDFDQLLSKPKFSLVEKIKTIGSSYMVAAGLTPGVEGDRQEDSREQHFAVILVEFALQLMLLLEQINKESFQVFALRVGLSRGPVVAGVVGGGKPQYDIWGNTVNVASRMESTGEMGRIQSTEAVMSSVAPLGYSCTFRGNIQVKGKGALPTYWVCKK